jgi:photosystem I P700 chlorophyll a apoprotein A2
MSIIFSQITKLVFHIGWNGNYEYWITNPTNIQPLGHSLWDPNILSSISENFSLYITSSVYYVLLKIKITSNKEIYSYIIISEIFSLLYIIISKINKISTDNTLN